MPDEGYIRKLSAIFSADAVGYSRLMVEDEEATVKTIASYREIMASLVKQHRGRIVDSPGDNVLAEFSSVVDAVKCAVAAQNELQLQNAELAENRKMEFRIGINLGDVIDEDDRIYGDGVNVAARLEALADPGGICVSKTAFDQIETKLPLGYEYLGEQSVKNIPKPIGAYRVLMKPDAAGKVIGEKRFIGRITCKIAMAVIIILIVIAGGLIGWNIYLQQSKIVEPANLNKMQFPLPDKPSIAVLPFDNLSDDGKQEYWCDGLTEEIITALSRIPNTFVIARNSVFTYKGKPIKVKRVAEELGVRYALEGSVRSAGDKVRVTAQLIDAVKGNHLWAERYDRNLTDIFAIQDEVTKQIISSIHSKLTLGEKVDVYASQTNNLDALLKLLQAREYHFQFTKEDNVKSRRLSEEVIEIDPDYGQAYVLLAATYFLDIHLGAAKSPRHNLEKALELAKKAVTIDGPNAHAMLANLYRMARQYDKAIAECQTAIRLDPNSASAHAWYGSVLNSVGKVEESILEWELSLRLDPFAPTWVLRGLAFSYIKASRYEKAIANLNRAIQKARNDQLSYIGLVLAHGYSGQAEQAKSAASEVLRINPKFSIAAFMKRSSSKDESANSRTIDALRRAGLE